MNKAPQVFMFLWALRIQQPWSLSLKSSLSWLSVGLNNLKVGERLHQGYCFCGPWVHQALAPVLACPPAIPYPSPSQQLVANFNLN